MLPNTNTKPVAVLGWPVCHSLSPLIHNIAFRTQGLNRTYLASPVQPDHLAAAIRGLLALGFSGANVTIPHKEAAFRLMDQCSEAAQAIGAVNTIVCKVDEEGHPLLYGDNTDVVGFLTPLWPYVAAFAGKEAVVFGAGGATRAVLYGLLMHLDLYKIRLVVRSPEKAQGLIAAMRPYDPDEKLSIVAWPVAGPVIRAAHLLVNATPKGMYPHIEEPVWGEVADFGVHHTAYDLIYNPVQTRFLREVANAGGNTIGGLEMFIGQAAAAYRQWTEVEMPVEVVREVLDRHFSKESGYTE
ncbi:MAG TPA: shikimate dehydrogenase [Rhodothermales bacterium]|nr:shikimate dehydrogenase [Rhodothermales bacterium]HRR08771.1 shikimate dehydrogenase [Rhodothermales bacterium]